MEKIQIIIIKNIKMFIITSVILISSYFIFYLDLFDLDLFNKKYIENLENELIELKKETINLKTIKEIENENPVYQWIGGIVLVAGTLFLFYYLYHGGDHNNLLSPPSSNIYNNLPFEETEIKYSHDSVTRRLNFSTTPSPSPPKALARYTGEISPLYEKGLKSLQG